MDKKVIGWWRESRKIAAKRPRKNRRSRAYRNAKRRREKLLAGIKVGKRTRAKFDEAVARHRALRGGKRKSSQQAIQEAIASLSPNERAALVANPDVIPAIEKMLEKLLFQFS